MHGKIKKRFLTKKLILDGIDLHGHSGPYLMLGIKMGLLALEKLDSKGNFDIDCEIETGTHPPISCMIDGVQISTGCTLGKGNIKVKNNKKPIAKFTKEKSSVTIEVKKNVIEEVENSFRNHTEEKLVKKILSAKDQELFKIKEEK